MNKVIKYIVVLFALSLTSCSSDSTAEATETDSFKIAVNGEDYSADNYFSGLITKTEDTFLIDIRTNYGLVQLSFNKSGQLGYFNVDRQTGTAQITSLFYTSYFNTAENFTFYLISVDEINKRIKGSYSGYIYADPRNINSEKKFITGDFNLKYEDNIPGVFGLGNKAKINGTDWLSVNKEVKRGAGGVYTNITQHDFNGGEYEIITNTNSQSLAVGTYNFTSNNLGPKIEVAKYNPVTATTTVYNATGTLTITKRNGNIVYGNYNFTATNPENSADVIAVTDGEIKFVYYNF